MTDYVVNCNGVIGVDCDNCTEICIMKLSDIEWESYKLYHKDISNALHEQKMIDDDINEYYRLKKELDKKGLVVEECVNINLEYLHRRKREVTSRLKKLRKMEYNYTKKLLKLQKKEV